MFTVVHCASWASQGFSESSGSSMNKGRRGSSSASWRAIGCDASWKSLPHQLNSPNSLQAYPHPDAPVLAYRSPVPSFDGAQTLRLAPARMRQHPMGNTADPRVDVRLVAHFPEEIPQRNARRLPLIPQRLVDSGNRGHQYRPTINPSRHRLPRSSMRRRVRSPITVSDMPHLARRPLRALQARLPSRCSQSFRCANSTGATHGTSIFAM